MADPITWGLINLVRKGIKGVQTTLDGVSDKVSGLPDSLDADFTEVKSLINDTKQDIEVKLESLDQAINNVQILTSNTNSMVNDLLYDKNSSEWITDLETSGKASVTYSTPERMEYLFSLNSAVTNTKIDTLLFEYGLTNNLNVGLFYQALLGNVSGVTWSELTTFDSVCKNSSAFKKICDTNRSITLIKNNGSAFSTMANNYAFTESIIQASATALNTLKTNNLRVLRSRGYTGTEINKIAWVDHIEGTSNGNFDARWEWSYRTMDGQTHTGQTIGEGYNDSYGSYKSLTIQRFVNLVQVTSLKVSGGFSGDGTAYAYIYGTNVK